MVRSSIWKGATYFYHADTLSNWYKRKNLPHIPAAMDEESLRQLSDMICDYFHHVEGRGKTWKRSPAPSTHRLKGNFHVFANGSDTKLDILVALARSTYGLTGQDVEGSPKVVNSVSRDERDGFKSILQSTKLRDMLVGPFNLQS